ncbi:outer membrane beta-barrel protein [candidate division KSB3 bacterium]|uniref:Outer membrane beta-barrel protein n=1 Tax=candidate division KSB3 bacterium TaxID=2044937 RepID=A0A9D5Q740_9BACT|nr:outer membrane beta-barrel protein [candidate division KSB3 bacterium]MBD3326038.1 outer membrane beta-barrel protein [candidate division KSB3 bacterium]
MVHAWCSLSRNHFQVKGEGAYMGNAQNDRLYTRTRVWSFSVIVLVGVLCIWNSAAHALWIGQSQINPYVEVQGMYESNIFEVNEDLGEEESDFITMVSPGIDLLFPTFEDSIYRLMASYRADFKFYTNHDDADIDPDGELNTVDHRFDGQLQLNFASGLRLKSGYTLNMTSTDPDFQGDERDEYLDHRFLVQAGYAFVDRYEVEVQYSGGIRSFDEEEDEIDDFTTHGIEMTAFYQLFPRLSVLAGGSYAMYDREEPVFSDSDEYAGFGGARYEVSERTAGILKVGAIAKEFDEDGFEDTTELYLSGEAQVEFSESTSLHARLRRSITEAATTNNTADNGAYYITTSLNARVSHALAALPNLSLFGSFFYSNEDYPDDPEERSDDNLEAGVGVNYQFLRYITAGASYTYKTTDSSLDSEDFTNNIAMFSIRGKL